MVSFVTLLGRILLALIFIMSGISKIGGYSGTIAYMQAHHIPVAPLFLYIAVLIELGGGLSIATGFRARIGALVLVAFLIPTTFLFHLKPAFDASFNVVDKLQLIESLKNMGLIGGLLMVYGNGAGKFTIGKDS